MSLVSRFLCCGEEDRDLLLLGDLEDVLFDDFTLGDRERDRDLLFSTALSLERDLQTNRDMYVRT